MIRNSLKNDCNNLYLHFKSFKITLKLNSYLMSISRCNPVNWSTPTFPNTNLTKTIRNLLVISKFTKKLLQQYLFPPLYLWHDLQTILLSDVTSLLWPGESANPNFPQYQSDRNNDKFICCLAVYSKMNALISVCTKIP